MFKFEGGFERGLVASSSLYSFTACLTFKMRTPWPASLLWLLAGSFGAHAAIEADDFRSVPVSLEAVNTARRNADNHLQLRSHSITAVSHASLNPSNVVWGKDRRCKKA